MDVDEFSRDEPRFPWERWIGGAVVTLGAVIFLAGFVNNDQDDEDGEHALARVVMVAGAVSGALRGELENEVGLWCE